LSFLQIRIDEIDEEYLTFETFAELGDWLHEYMMNYSFLLRKLGDFFNALPPIDMSALWDRYDENRNGVVKTSVLNEMFNTLAHVARMHQFLPQQELETFIDESVKLISQRLGNEFTREEFEQFGNMFNAEAEVMVNTENEITAGAITDPASNVEDMLKWLRVHSDSLDQFWTHFFQERNVVTCTEFEDFIFQLLAQIQGVKVSDLRTDEQTICLVKDILPAEEIG